MNKKLILSSLILLVVLCNAPLIDTTQSSLPLASNDRLTPAMVTRTVGPPETWSKTYGNTSEQWFQGMALCSDGGFAMVGSIETTRKDGYFVRVDANGNHLWNKTYGGTGTDRLYDVIALSDGYILAGWTYSYGAGLADLWLIRTDASGNIVWNRTYGGAYFETDPLQVVACSDGGYTIAATTTSYGGGNDDVYLVHTDYLGYMEWNKTYGGTGNEQGADLVEVSGGGYAITGYTSDALLIRTDEDGNHLWNQTYGGAGMDRGNSIVECSDGGYAIAGMTYSYAAVDTAAWLIRTDVSGNLLWNMTYDEPDYVGARDLIEYSKGGFVLAGYNEIGDRDNGLLIRTDSSGNMLWNSSYGGPPNEEFYALVESGNGDIVAAGEAADPTYDDYNGWLVKTEYPLAWDPAPADQTVPYGIGLAYDLNVSSYFSVAWALNNTGFAVSSDGVVSIAVVLPFGVYGLRVTVTDSVGNVISGDFSVTIEAPAWAAFFTANLPMIFHWVLIIVVAVLLLLLHQFVLCKRKR